MENFKVGDLVCFDEKQHFASVMILGCYFRILSLETIGGLSFGGVLEVVGYYKDNKEKWENGHIVNFGRTRSLTHYMANFDIGL